MKKEVNTENDIITSFILIDDDAVTISISKHFLKMAIDSVRIVSFTQGAAALEYIKKMDSVAPGKTIILLDLNMPTISGWEFLEYFDNLSKSVKGQFKIYILSSSVDQRDKDRSYANKNVTGFLVKPLTKEVATEISNDI